MINLAGKRTVFPTRRRHLNYLSIDEFKVFVVVFRLADEAARKSSTLVNSLLNGHCRSPGHTLGLTHYLSTRRLHFPKLDTRCARVTK